MPGLMPRHSLSTPASIVRLPRPASRESSSPWRAWIHSGTWITRHNALVALASGRRDEAGPMRVELARLFPEREPEALARAVRARLLPEGGDRALEDAILASARAPGEPAQACVAALLTAPEFQLY